MSIQQSTELIIFVTHVEAEDSFLKIWGQVDKNSATCVERMILPLVERFARSQGCVGPQAANLRINALCCARFQNEGYYRARIINIRADNMIVLQFIDYGNIDVLPPQEIHLLENIPGSESLQSFPPVAFDFTLMHVLPVNGIWENKIIDSIKKTLWYNEYKILINSVVNNHRFIKLWYNNEDFGELLIKRHMAVGATLQDMFRPKCVQQPQVPIYPQSNKQLISNNCTSVTSMQNLNSLHCDGNDMHEYQQNISLCCGAQQKHMMQTPVQEALVFKSRVLDVGSKHDVYVSFVEDGPYKFSVQVQSTSQILSMLMRDINSHPIEPLQEPPLPGSVCLGRYTQDKVLCRAVVMSVMENKCKLYYVDFGHTEVLPYTDIFQLPPHYINPRVLSIRFTLSGVHELKVTDEMKEYFKRIVSGKLLVLHVRPPEGPPLVQYGDLYDDGKNIKDILRQAFPPPTVMSPVSPSFGYQESRKLLKGVEEIVHVSFVESCKKFFVQLDSNINSLETIMNCLAEFCKTASTLNITQLKIGLPCAALYDNQWYRAEVIGITTENVKVLYVDYGNEETVTLISLRSLHDDLVKKLQAQAIRCILNGWELLPQTQEVYNQFELLTLEKRLCLKVIDVNKDGIVVDLYEPETMADIKTQMLHTIGDDKQLINESKCTSIENEYSPKSPPKFNQSENTNKWQKRSPEDSWNQSQNSNIIQERQSYKSKTWKDESNEGKQYESKNEKGHFHRSDMKNERFNRDDYSNNRNMKDKWSNKIECNDTNSFKSGRGSRGGRNRTSGYSSKSHSSDKSWSDKDSDTSSRSGGRYGRGSASRGGYSKRDGVPGRMQGNRSSNDRDSEGVFKTGKPHNDSYHGGNKFKERRGQSYRIQQNKVSALSLNTGEKPRRYSPMQNRKELHIPSPSIIVGSSNTCEVVYTNSLSDFFIQLSPDYTALDTLMENIALIYENGGELMRSAEILSGVYCIAQYSDDFKWYRAMIKSVEDNSATVQFVDYGNVETVDFDKMKSIQREFLDLPVQAVHCKLFGIKDATINENKSKMFEDKVTGKTLDAEFVTEENGTYSILLREVIDGCPASTFVNDEFCQGIDLLKAKENAMSCHKAVGNTRRSTECDYASFDATWATISHAPGTKKDVIVTWFINPNNFYCQILDNENEFRTMMNDIQRVYVDREPVSYALKTGSPVIALFADDGALYRAEVVELHKLNGHLVQYIDFGNSAVVNPQKIYPVEKKFMQLPKQAVQCTLQNIVPQGDHSWSNVNTQEIDSCFNADKFECTFYDMKEDVYMISLNNNGSDVANMLVEKHLASCVSASESDTITKDENCAPTITCDLGRIDINLLSGQTLRVKVSNVESTSKFYIQLDSAVECENIINTFMGDKNPEVMQRLTAHEICLGTGCLVYSNGIWRRAVINSHSQSTGFEVKFIDTGVYDEILSDSVLALPGELSVMQNQAIECSLVDVTSSPDANAVLKNAAEGKEVIMHVNEVDNNRLIVKLFDLLGNKINILEDTTEKISPICPMPILSSTHKVSVSYADHSASIWLQRISEYECDKNLSEALDEYYTTSGEPVEPEENLLCAAKSADGHWYRARIIQYTENGAYVHNIDYGNNEEVTRDVLMNLDSKFYVPYQLAVNVSLPVTLNGTISEQLVTLQNYLANKELTAVFYNVKKKWVVELLCDGEKISDKFRSFNLESQKEISGIKGPHVHAMAVGCKYDMYVSHVDSPSQFWLQSVDDATDLSKNQEELQIQASTFPRVDGVPEEGSLCVAVYTIDNSWYRAQVLDADEDITTVRFIDYGNTDVIDNKSENIRQISDSWKEIKEYAVKCRLDVIPMDSEDWSATSCERFENLVTSVESVQASIITSSVPKRVDLLIDGKSVTELLVEEQLAVMVHTEEEIVDEIVDLELDPHSAFVSHINSPSEFWVQEEKSVGDLEVMTDRFIVAHMFPKVDEIQEDMLCVAKYPDDDCWYRARVISHNDNATHVIYIDYGNSAISTEIRAIPPDLADVPPLSRKCHLVMPEGITEWSEKACEEFVKLAADGATIFLLDVLKEDETSLVKLTLNGESVTDLLGNFCVRYPPIIEERLPPLGEENSPNVYISRVNSPSDFWIQTESSTADLNMMLDRLQAAPDFPPLSTFEIGTICAAKFLDDGQWYRAKILSHTDDNTEVLYIDYGNTATTDELRTLPVDIINIPTFAKRCSLQKADVINSWPIEARNRFEKLAADGESMFQLEILNDTNDPIYVKLSFNGRNVVDILSDVEENANLSEDANTGKISENCEENENFEIPSEDIINKTEENNINDNENEVINSHAPETENVEDQCQEIKEDAHNPDVDIRPIIELTVDEIIQNMERNIIDGTEEEGEEEKSFNNNVDASESCKHSDIEKIRKSLENIDTSDEKQSCSSPNETQKIEIDIEMNNSVETINEQTTLLNVIENDTTNVTKDDTNITGTQDSVVANMNELKGPEDDTTDISDIQDSTVANMNDSKGPEDDTTNIMDTQDSAVANMNESKGPEDDITDIMDTQDSAVANMNESKGLTDDTTNITDTQDSAVESINVSKDSEKEDTALADINVSEYPEKEDSALADVNDSKSPEKEDSIPADINDSKGPEKEDSIPVDINVSEYPEKEDSALADVNDSKSPKKEDSIPADINDFKGPEKEDSIPVDINVSEYPEKEDSALADVNDSKSPEKEDSIPADINVSKGPEKEDSALADIDNSKGPDKEDSALADIDNSKGPDKEDSALADANDSKGPEKEDSALADANDSKGPEKEDSALADANDSKGPEKEDSALADVNDSKTSKVEKDDIPDTEATEVCVSNTSTQSCETNTDTTTSKAENPLSDPLKEAHVHKIATNENVSNVLNDETTAASANEQENTISTAHDITVSTNDSEHTDKKDPLKSESTSETSE